MLKFSDIEHILGFELCKSAYKYSCYWYRKGSALFSNCWLDNGFTIKKLYLDKRRVVFRKNRRNVSNLNIPPVILFEKLPNGAIYEFEIFFDYIIKKYGL